MCLHAFNNLLVVEIVVSISVACFEDFLDGELLIGLLDVKSDGSGDSESGKEFHS